VKIHINSSRSPRASLATLLLPVGRAGEAQRQSRRNAGGDQFLAAAPSKPEVLGKDAWPGAVQISKRSRLGLRPSRLALRLSRERLGFAPRGSHCALAARCMNSYYTICIKNVLIATKTTPCTYVYYTICITIV
jgi:hypothetical protein